MKFNCALPSLPPEFHISKTTSQRCLTYICRVSLLYPLFLWAGLALAIPVLIHLFNLRKYKTVLFPHTRFLRSIQLHSRKQNEVRYKWLLLTRLLFLLLLILAFAQPFFKSSSSKASEPSVKVIYLDNSFSMSAARGARTLLDVAKQSATDLIRKSQPGSRFLVIDNGNPESYYPVPADKAQELLNRINFAAASKNVSQVLSQVHSLMQDQPNADAALYYYSDFQQSAFPEAPAEEAMKHIYFNAIPVRADSVRDFAIDTAYLLSPVLETGKPNNLVIRSHATGAIGDAHPAVRLRINGQVKSAATLTFSDKNESRDTLGFSINDNHWQQIELTIDDALLPFDDTFRIAARTAPDLSVLVVGDGKVNPFIQAAFRAYRGFRLNSVGTIRDAWKDYNLIILDNPGRIDEALGLKLNDALQAGQTVCIFPGRTSNFSQLNEGLSKIGDIRFTGLDTSVQTASSLQQGSELVKDLFEKIPDNVQLPVANWHYAISAGISANQQSVLSFRNGDPFFARFTPSKGSLYICATSADLTGGNFPGSYFFTPFLYKMAMQAGAASTNAIASGSHQAIYLPLSHVSGRDVMHLYRDGADRIPPQRVSGAGLEVYPDQVAKDPGFYTLAGNGMDTVLVALNADKAESRLEYRDIQELKRNWKSPRLSWIDAGENNHGIGKNGNDGFPLWKWCVLAGVVMLGLETWLLARR